MNHWQSLKKERQVEIINQVSNEIGMPVNAVEKDWWVTTVLKALFQTKCNGNFDIQGRDFIK